MQEFVVQIAGEGGEGVISAGEMIALACARLYLQVFTFRTYPAEIKGGPAMYQVHAGRQDIVSQGDLLDILVCFNQQAYQLQQGELKPGGLLIYDPQQVEPDPAGRQLLAVPLGEIATARIGSKLSKNLVAVGALAAVIGLPLEPLEQMIGERFKRKGEAILEKNRQALYAGHAYVREHWSRPELLEREGLARYQRMVLSGNEALALGALAGGCSFFAGYPISPASEILEWMSRYLPAFGGKVVQAEDEISALGMVLGASYAGRKAMTATSGPGLSLMTEEIGLAAMTETPVVIVDAQRGGPSTGLPTKAEQGDLNLAIYGAHGEAPRIVLAPTDVEDCFYTMVDAFNLAEKYQTPVLVLSDQTLSHRTQTVPRFMLELVCPDERIKPLDQELQSYQRYRDTESGISPMSIPGMPGGEYVATGLEHDQMAAPDYSPQTHHRMMEKRRRKLEGAALELNYVRRFGDPNPELGIIGWGSTSGAVREAVARAAKAGHRVAALYPRMIHPLRVRELAEFIKPLRWAAVAELNMSGQFADLLTRQFKQDFLRLNKWEGIPFTPGEVSRFIEEVFKGAKLEAVAAS